MPASNTPVLMMSKAGSLCNSGSESKSIQVVRPWTLINFPCEAVTDDSIESILSATHVGATPESKQSGTALFGWSTGGGGLQMFKPILVGANNGVVDIAIALCRPRVMRNRGNPSWNDKPVEWCRDIIYTAQLTSGTVGSFSTAYNDSDGSNQSLNVADIVTENGDSHRLPATLQPRWMKDVTAINRAAVCLFDCLGAPFVQVYIADLASSGAITHATLEFTETNGG
jgi:hypothetical protein